MFNQERVHEKFLGYYYLLLNLSGIYGQWLYNRLLSSTHICIVYYISWPKKDFKKQYSTLDKRQEILRNPWCLLSYYWYLSFSFICYKEHRHIKKFNSATHLGKPQKLTISKLNSHYLSQNESFQQRDLMWVIQSFHKNQNTNLGISSPPGFGK